MDSFLNRFAGQVKGVISGWDRLGVRGTIRRLASRQGLATFMGWRSILLKDFKVWAEGLTSRLRAGCDETAEALGIETVYLRSSAVNKEELARAIAEERKIKEGPICRFSVVEPCVAPMVVGNRASKRLEVEYRLRRCVWEYMYFIDPICGFGHLRLQTWLPFTIKGCLNGRHWLERDLMREGIGYVKSGNCFRAIEDCKRAQELVDAQLQTDWAELLSGQMRRCFPGLDGLLEGLAERPLEYYWSVEESEWATDVMFRNTAELDRLFPMLARHGMMITDSASVMRYLGQISADGALPGRLQGDVRSDVRRRHEGVRVKHSHGGNSVKMYNKAGNVLRVETTINAPKGFRVFRPDAGSGKWMRMRKGVADLHRRAEVSQKSNARYLAALDACQSGSTVMETLTPVCARQKQGGRKARALNPWSGPDRKLIEFLGQGEWAINGLRNRDLAHWLEPGADELDKVARCKLSAKASRLLAMLRAHGLIAKVPKTHRYQVTAKGHQLATLVLAASNVQTKTLVEMAA